MRLTILNENTTAFSLFVREFAKIKLEQIVKE